MKKFLDVCLWIIGLFFLLCSLGLLLSPEVRGMGIFFALLGITLLPPLRNKINNKLHTFFTVFNKNSNSENTNLVLIKALIGIFKFIVFSILFICIIISMPEPQNVNTISDNTVTTKNSTKSKYRNNKNAKLIANVTGLNKDQAGKVYETLVSCGVGNITNIENQEYGDVYYIEAFGIPVKLIAYIDKEGNITELHYDMKDIIVESKRVAKITDYILNSNEWLDLRTQSQIYIEKFLNAPKTAKYRNMNYSIDENKVIRVYGTVEAQNLFGVPLENGFEIEYTNNNGNFSIKNAILAGKKIY